MRRGTLLLPMDEKAMPMRDGGDRIAAGRSGLVAGHVTSRAADNEATIDRRADSLDRKCFVLDCQSGSSRVRTFTDKSFARVGCGTCCGGCFNCRHVSLESLHAITARIPYVARTTGLRGLASRAGRRCQGIETAPRLSVHRIAAGTLPGVRDGGSQDFVAEAMRPAESAAAAAYDAERRFRIVRA